VRHELRTPLNAVLGLSEALLGDVDGPLTEGQRENLSVIAGTARRLSDLFDDVLELSTDAPTDRFRTREAVDLGAVLDELSEALERSRGARLVHFRVVAQQDLSPALANPHRLQRLIGSVGRYALSVCAGELLELRARTRGATHTCVDVVDPARTLSADELRVLTSTETSPLRRRGLDESARLRLSMFRQLAEREGGVFELESNRSGTRMSLVLPTAAVAPSEPPPASDAGPTPSRGGRRSRVESTHVSEKLKKNGQNGR
jgi:signal transduction histidine kinase